jgi:hypothetical protein
MDERADACMDKYDFHIKQKLSHSVVQKIRKLQYVATFGA